MKRIFVIWGLFVLVAGLAACGGDDDKGSSWSTEPDNTETTLSIPTFQPITAENVAQVSLWQTVMEVQNPSCGETVRGAWSSDGTILGLVTDKTICLHWLLYPESQPRQIDLSADAHAVAFSPDGKTLAAGSGQRKYELRLYDLETGKNTRTFKNDRSDVTQIAFSPDGSQVATIWKGATVYVWNVADGKVVHQFVNPDNSARAVAISPDGTLLVTAGWESMQFWNLETGEPILHVVHDTHEPWRAVFSPDSTLLATWGGSNGDASVWDVATGELKYEVSGSGMNRSAFFTADGSALLIGYNGGTVYAWDVATGELITTLKDMGDSIALSPDGTTILATKDDAPVTLWAVQAE